MLYYYDIFKLSDTYTSAQFATTSAPINKEEISATFFSQQEISI